MAKTLKKGEAARRNGYGGDRHVVRNVTKSTTIIGRQVTVPKDELRPSSRLTKASARGTRTPR